MQIWSQRARHLNTSIQSGELLGPVKGYGPDFFPVTVSRRIDSRCLNAGGNDPGFSGFRSSTYLVRT
jgi:hypothetical protein